MVSSVIDVTAADFASSVLETSHQVPVVVDLWAEWCGPCKVLGPVLERAAGDGGGRWLLAKLDVDANPQLAQQFGVQGIPTVIAFKDGEEVDRFTGALPEAQVRAFIDRLLPSELDLATAQGDVALDAGDSARAAEIYRSVLASDPSHQDAGLSLAGLLLEDDDREGALEILGRLAPTDAVKQLQAYARLGGETGDLGALEAAAVSGGPEARLALGRAQAGAGEPERAIATLMGVMGERTEPESEEARSTLIDLFELLGGDNPAVTDARRRLANGLY
jgi:putative thioredoxin